MSGTKMSVKTRWGIIQWSLVSLLVVGLLVWPIAGGAQSPATSFSGQATVVKATVLGTTTNLADTGPLPGSGGALETSLLDLSVPGMLTAQVGHASAMGSGNVSRSEASVANLSLTVAGNTIGADFLMARAKAVCGPGGPSVSGSSEIANLVVNGMPITVTGAPNQTVSLPVGQVIINEQSGSSSSLTVNALHVIVPGVADVIIASAHADITCGAATNCPGANDFVTGGGFIIWPTGSNNKAHFAVAGRNLQNWGHVLYHDGTTSLHIKNPFAVVYNTLAGLESDTRSNQFSIFQSVKNSLDPTKFQGAAILTGTDDLGNTVNVLAIDMGEPGHGNDFFELLSQPTGDAGGFLAGGNIQMHGKCE